jgi:FKBP-type peptidyl-prolyl cis-trans isomerase 2
MERGDFVTINYIARVRDTMKVFDTNIEEVARKEGIHTQNAIYGPVTIVLGAGHVISGLEKALLDMDVGEEKEVDIKPSEAFGKRNRSLITKIPLREFKKRGVLPRPGMRMEINDRWATVRQVTSGRVILDFNHPLSGRVLHYSVQLLGKVEDTKEQIEALLTVKGVRGDVTLKEEEFSISLNVEEEKKKRVQRLVERDIKKYVPQAKISFLS